MKTDSQHLQSTSLSFYKKRKFWAVIFFIFFVFSTVFALYAMHGSWSKLLSNLNNVYSIVTISYGATLFRFILFDLFTKYGGYIGSSIYFLSILFLGYKTFQKQTVLLRYPILLSILYITGMITSVLLIGSLS